MDPNEYPSPRNDWGLCEFGDFGLSPNANVLRESPAYITCSATASHGWP